MYGQGQGTSRSPPPLQHPRPQHPPSHIPSTSPPPPSDFGSDDAYQRFSSPPVSANSHLRLPHQQQQQQQQHHHLNPYSSSTPESYIPAGHHGGMGYAAPHQGPPQQSFMSSSAPWLSSGAAGGGQNGAAGGGGPQWPGMNDATAQMGVQFGRHAFDAGQAYLDRNFTRLLPLAHLKHSFNVSNGYVLLKLRLVLWPWRHRPWSRSLQRSETSGVAEGWKPPREDINCPDLYIPVMALTTYMLLSAIVAGSQGQFDPSILGRTASKSFGILFLEFVCIKLGCYLLGIGQEGAVLDLVAYEGYKFVGIIVTLIAGLVGAKRWLYWLVFFYVFLANFFFLLRSLRHIVLPDPALSPLDTSHHSPATTASSITHSQRTMRIQFLFFIAAAQGLSMGVLVRV